MRSISKCYRNISAFDGHDLIEYKDEAVLVYFGHKRTGKKVMQ